MDADTVIVVERSDTDYSQPSVLSKTLHIEVSDIRSESCANEAANSPRLEAEMPIGRLMRLKHATSGSCKDVIC